MPHLWSCIWAEHNHHSGCGDLLWLSDAVDDWLAIICLVTDQPREVLAILGMSICMLYDTCSDRSVPFADFAKDFNESIIETHKDVSSMGPVTRQ
jgi:hypothetical protein